MKKSNIPYFALFILALLAIVVTVLLSDPPRPRYASPDCGPPHHAPPVSALGPRSEWDL